MQDSSGQKPQEDIKNSPSDEGVVNGPSKPSDIAETEVDGDKGKDEEPQEATESSNGTSEKTEPNSEAADATDGIELTQEKFDDLRDKWMRALAEVENIRRRADRDVKDVARFQQTRLARDLLPVHDSLKRALLTLDEGKDDSKASVVEGIELTLKEFLNALGKHGVKVVAPDTGDPFDSKLHEAMFQAPTDEVPAGNIVSVMTEGFTIHERLLRPAQVAVSSGPAKKKD